MGMDRRGFLAGVAAAGATMVAHQAAGQEAGMDKVRIGIAGGRFGASFQWHEHPQCMVAAVTDLRADRRANLQKVYGCANAYPSLEEMVKDPNLDAIGVFTDGPLHVQHAKLCFEHGKHVISAVPACMGHSVQEGLDQAAALLEAVQRSGLTYMMAETSYWQQVTLTVRKLYLEGRLGEIFMSESDYLHPGLKELYQEGGQRTWRHGVPPMFYPTHCTAHLLSLTGERLVQVSCDGWGNDDPVCRDNAFSNPFWNETAHFRTNLGHPFRVRVWWEGPFWGGEVASWHGTRMAVIRTGDTYQFSDEQRADDAGYAVMKPQHGKLETTEWWNTDLLPEPLRHNTGHQGSHSFITHEFIDALVHERRPAVDVYEALSYTVPGIVAHESALKGGEALKIPEFIRPG